MAIFAPPILPPAGSRVHMALYGAHSFNGTCLYHQTDRWGTHAVILLDCGVIDTCSGLTDRGIGWYAGANRHAHSPEFKPYMLGEDA